MAKGGSSAKSPFCFLLLLLQKEEGSTSPNSPLTPTPLLTLGLGREKRLPPSSLRCVGTQFSSVYKGKGEATTASSSSSVQPVVLAFLQTTTAFLPFPCLTLPAAKEREKKRNQHHVVNVRTYVRRCVVVPTMSLFATWACGGGGWSVFKEGKLFFTLGHGGEKCCCLLRVFPIMLYTANLPRGFPAKLCPGGGRVQVG